MYHQFALIRSSFSDPPYHDDGGITFYTVTDNALMDASTKITLGKGRQALIDTVAELTGNEERTERNPAVVVMADANLPTMDALVYYRNACIVCDIAFLERRDGMHHSLSFRWVFNPSNPIKSAYFINRVATLIAQHTTDLLKPSVAESHGALRDVINGGKLAILKDTLVTMLTYGIITAPQHPDPDGTPRSLMFSDVH